MLTVPSRRGFLGGMGALIVAPSIVRADSLMKMGMHERIRRYVPMLMGHHEWGADGKWLTEITECWMWDHFEERVAWIKTAPSDSALAQEWRSSRDARRYNTESWWGTMRPPPYHTARPHVLPKTPDYYLEANTGPAWFKPKHPATGKPWPWG